MIMWGIFLEPIAIENVVVQMQIIRTSATFGLSANNKVPLG